MEGGVQLREVRVGFGPAILKTICLNIRGLYRRDAASSVILFLPFRMAHLDVLLVA